VWDGGGADAAQEEQVYGVCVCVCVRACVRACVREGGGSRHCILSQFLPSPLLCSMILVCFEPVMLLFMHANPLTSWVYYARHTPG